MQIPLKPGDIVLSGRFKNKSNIVASLTTDEHNQPVVVTKTGKKIKLLAVRIKKLMKEENLTLSEIRNYIRKFLLFESKASEQAHKKGLESAGFGNWKDESGKVVAKTKDGELTKVGSNKKDDTDKKDSNKKDKPADKKTTTKKPTETKKPVKDDNKKNDGPKTKKDSISGNPKAERKIVKELDRIFHKVNELKKDNKPIPNFDLCKVTIPGTNLFCGGNKGIPREEMPQLKGTPEKGSIADKLQKDKDGQANIEDLFKKSLVKAGHKIETKEIDVTKLKATQNQLVGSKIVGMLDALKNKTPEETAGIRAPIFISKDGYILDGHHRWAALVGLDLSNGGGPDVKMNVMQVDMNATDLVKYTNKFASKIGIKQKKANVKENKIFINLLKDI